MINIERIQLSEAAAAGVITREQADRLWIFLVERKGTTPAPVTAARDAGPSFTFTNVLY